MKGDIRLSLTKEVNDILSKMHNSGEPKSKGVYGEQACLSICETIYRNQGGILIHSYAYKTVPGLAGNIKFGNGFYVENLGSMTEIDLLLVTPFRIFPIEVKSYKASKITLTNDRISGCRSTDKSPEHQNEMHCRHLYPHIYKNIPNGDTRYIVPIVVFVDETTVSDQRTKDHKDYIVVTVLNRLRSELLKHNVPIDNTKLNLKALEASLRSAMISNEKFLPYKGE